MKFHYYQGNWQTGFKLLLVIESEQLTKADLEFKQSTGLNPLMSGIVVTLQPKLD